MRLANSLFACAGSAAALLGAALAFAPAAPSAHAAAPAPAPAEGYGTIKGRLIFGGAVPTPPKLDTAKGNQEFCKDQSLVDRSLAVDPKTKGVSNAFVYLKAPKGKNADAEKSLVSEHPKVQIDNKNCQFEPYSTALFKGQQVEFTSSDPVGHNAHYTALSGQGANVALAPKGKVAAKLQAEKLPINLACDIHPWMKGKIMVFDHPFFAVTKEDGTFEITGVPAGTQNVIVWQERVGYVTPGKNNGKPVEVKAGGTVDLGDVVLDPATVKP